VTLEAVPSHVLVEHVLPRLGLAGVCAVGACSRQLREVAGAEAFWRGEAERYAARGPGTGGRVPVGWARRVGALVEHLGRAGALTEKQRFACARAAHLRAFRYSGLQAAVEAGDVAGVVGQIVARCAGGDDGAPREDKAVEAAGSATGGERSRWRRYRFRARAPVARVVEAPPSLHPSMASLLDSAVQDVGGGGGGGGSGKEEAERGGGGFTANATTGKELASSEIGALAGVLARAARLVNQQGERGALPLRAAVRSGDGTMVKVLLALGADASSSGLGA